MSFALFEDETLRKVFAVTLDASKADPSASPPIIHLAELEKELRLEDGDADGSTKLLLDRFTAERALMSRLSNPPASGYPQWPVHYLLGCYARAQEESRSASMLKDPADQTALLESLTLARQLTVSYSGFILTMEMFPQPENAQKRGALQLLDSLFAACSSSGLSMGFTPTTTGNASLIPSAVSAETQVVPMPPAFLEDFATRFAEEGLEEVLLAIAPALMKKLAVVSILGDYAGPMNALEYLLNCKPIAAALVKHPFWLPRPGSDGRAVEFQTILGAAFGISAVPDIFGTPSGFPTIRQPDVAHQLFPNMVNPRQSDVRTATSSLQATLGQLHTQLHRIMMTLLRNGEAREAALEWLGAALRTNQERAKMHPNFQKSATDGFLINVGAVLLKMCDPFIDPENGKAWPRLDARYASDPNARGRCFEDDTRLGAASDEVAKWAKEAIGGDIKYHFICECFFLTAMSLRLGYCKAIDLTQKLMQEGRRYEEAAEEAPANLAKAQRYKAVAMTIDASLTQEGFTNDTIAYYRLLAAYMVRLASPAVAAGGPPALPLPEPAPMEFATLPEFFVEDLCNVLSRVGWVRPEMVTPPRMEQYMLFFTVMMGSPSHVKNPYLRAKMVEALSTFMPQGDEPDGWRARPSSMRAAAEVAMLFEVHPLVIGHMVKALISLYVDIERTDRSNTFYEKFNMRYTIGTILDYLWQLPQHRAAWRAISVNDSKLYIRFVNFLLADSQHLLQEALDSLPSVQETERLQDDAAAWNALPQQQRADRLQALENDRRHLRSDFALAEVYLRTMKFTSEDPTVASRFFDVQVRDRQARILNFFLRYLTLPAERKRLKLKDPEKYGWNPKELLASLAAIHVNLYRADREAWCEAVAADTDYYGPNPEIFMELIKVLDALSLASYDMIADLRALAKGAATAAENLVAEEDAFDDIPEEFEDPLLGGLMLDPVQLPSKNVVNRATILQQLLADQRDPFSRQPMTEDDLVELPELKAKVVAWVAEQRAKRKAVAEGAEPMETA